MKVTIGSPALTGVKSNELLADHFMQAAYPMNIRVINHMPRGFRHNNLKLNMLNCAGGVDTQADITVGGFSQIQKLCTEAEAISELNNYDLGIEIHDLDALAEAAKAVGESVRSEEIPVVLEPAQDETKPLDEPVPVPAKASKKGDK